MQPRWSFESYPEFYNEKQLLYLPREPFENNFTSYKNIILQAQNLDEWSILHSSR